ncbi:MAG: hypothetical protein P8X90_08225 [Desulfobacterales bacterium]
MKKKISNLTCIAGPSRLAHQFLVDLQIVLRRRQDFRIFAGQHVLQSRFNIAFVVMGNYVKAFLADGLDYLAGDFSGIQAALDRGLKDFQKKAASGVNSGGGGTLAGRLRSDELKISVLTRPGHRTLTFILESADKLDVVPCQQPMHFAG